MVIIQFQNREICEGEEIIFSDTYPVTSLKQNDGSKSPVYIVADHILFELDEKEISYIILSEKDLPNVLSGGGLDYFNLIKDVKERVDPSSRELPKPNEFRILFHCSHDRKEEALKVLEKLDYRNRKIENCVPIFVTADVSAEKIEEKLGFEGFLPKQNFKKLIEELGKRKIAGYNRETIIVRNRENGE